MFLSLGDEDSPLHAGALQPQTLLLTLQSIDISTAASSSLKTTQNFHGSFFQCK